MINIFNSDNSKIAKIKSQHHQIITTLIMKLKPMIKIPIVANCTFFTVVLARSIPSLKSILS